MKIERGHIQHRIQSEQKRVYENEFIFGTSGGVFWSVISLSTISFKVPYVAGSLRDLLSECSSFLVSKGASQSNDGCSLGFFFIGFLSNSTPS